MTEIINAIIAQYGLPGIVIVALTVAVTRLARRIKDLEDRGVDLEIQRYQALVKMVQDYGDNSKITANAINRMAECLEKLKE